jgi:hypothetical protein
MKIVKVEHDFKDPKGKTYGGMNQHAAKKLGIKWEHGDNAVAVSKSSNYKETAKHEIIEHYIMKAKPTMSYEEAHKLTGEIERVIELLVVAGLI